MSEIFAETVLPVFLVAIAGAVLASYTALDVRSIGRIVFFLGTPSLIFRSLYQTKFEWHTLQRLAGVAAGVMLITGVLSWAMSAGMDRRRRVAMILTGAVSNNGNMGLPICLFAFGQPGLALATIYYIATSFLGNTLGIVIASSGSRSVGAALLQGLRAPMLYAAIGGLVFNLLHWQLPVPVFRAVDLVADLAIPLMLVILGVQLRSTLQLHSPGLVARSVVIRLVAGPLAAWLICWLSGIGGVEQKVMVLQAAMPTAVITSVVANEFDAAPELVATDIFISTLLSMATLSVVLWWLNSV